MRARRSEAFVGNAFKSAEEVFVKSVGTRETAQRIGLVSLHLDAVAVAPLLTSQPPHHIAELPAVHGQVVQGPQHRPDEFVCDSRHRSVPRDVQAGEVDHQPIHERFDLPGAQVEVLFGLLERYSGIAKLRTGGKPSERPQNYAFLVKYTWTIMTFFSLAAMVIEIIIFVKKDILIALRSRIVRGLFYLIKGIGTLGAAGNIGQAAGAFEIISAIVIIAIEAIFIIRGGRGGGDGAYQETRDDGFRQAT